MTTLEMKSKTPTKTSPKTDAEWAAYRCQLSCRIGRDALEGKTKAPVGCSPLEFAVFNLLHAVEELSRLKTEKPPH